MRGCLEEFIPANSRRGATITCQGYVLGDLVEKIPSSATSMFLKVDAEGYESYLPKALKRAIDFMGEMRKGIVHIVFICEFSFDYLPDYNEETKTTTYSVLRFYIYLT